MFKGKINPVSYFWNDEWKEKNQSQYGSTRHVHRRWLQVYKNNKDLEFIKIVEI